MKTVKNWIQFNEGTNDDIVFEMSGSPRDVMTMFPPKERTKSIFAKELSKFGYVHGRLNKDCDLLVIESKDFLSNKAKKAEEYGCEVTTYKALIKKYNMFSDINEDYNYDEEPGNLLLTFEDGSPTTWYYINDAIINGLFEEKLNLDDDIIEKFGEDVLGEENMSMEDLADMMIDGYRDYVHVEILDALFDYLIENNLFDHYPSSIEITGTDEDEEEWEIIYIHDE